MIAFLPKASGLIVSMSTVPPTACETSATVATLNTCVSASARKKTVPAELTAAMAASPSFATK